METMTLCLPNTPSADGAGDRLTVGVAFVEGAAEDGLGHGLGGCCPLAALEHPCGTAPRSTRSAP